MEITKEILQKQLDTVKQNTDGFLSGYAQAFSFVLSVIESKEETPVEQSASK